MASATAWGLDSRSRSTASRPCSPALRAGRVVRGSIGVQLRHAAAHRPRRQSAGAAACGGRLITSVEKRSPPTRPASRPGTSSSSSSGCRVASADDVLTRVSSATPGVRARAVVIRDGRVHTRSTSSSSHCRSRAHSGSVFAIERSRRFGLTLADLRLGLRRSGLTARLVEQRRGRQRRRRSRESRRATSSGRSISRRSVPPPRRCTSCSACRREAPCSC